MIVVWSKSGILWPNWFAFCAMLELLSQTSVFFDSTSWSSVGLTIVNIVTVKAINFVYHTSGLKRNVLSTVENRLWLHCCVKLSILFQLLLSHRVEQQTMFFLPPKYCRLRCNNWLCDPRKQAKLKTAHGVKCHRRVFFNVFTYGLHPSRLIFSCSSRGGKFPTFCTRPKSSLWRHLDCFTARLSSFKYKWSPLISNPGYLELPFI